MTARPLIAAVLLSFLIACGGGGGSSPSPTPSPSPGTTNPCSSSAVTRIAAPPDELYAASKRDRVDSHSRYGIFDALAVHAARPTRATAGQTQPNNIDVGEIAIVQDEA